MLFALAVSSAAFAPTGTLRIADASTARPAIHPSMQFRSMQSTDTAAAEQADRAKAAGMTPAEYEEATRQAAKAHLQTIGLHADGAAGNGVQSPEFVRKMWGVPSVPAVPEASLSVDPWAQTSSVAYLGVCLPPVPSSLPKLLSCAPFLHAFSAALRKLLAALSSRVVGSCASPLDSHRFAMPRRCCRLSDLVVEVLLRCTRPHQYPPRLRSVQQWALAFRPLE